MEIGILTSISPVGSYHSKAMDRICWSVNLAGSFFGNCLTPTQPFSSSYYSALNPFSTIQCSHRMQIEQLVDHTKRCKMAAFEDGRMCPSRLRISRRHDRRGRAASRKTRIGSFVDEATAHSSDLEVSSPSSVSERDDLEAVEDDQERGPGIKSREPGTSADDYNYEDMRLGDKKDWSIADMEKLDRLRSFEYKYGGEKGVLVVQAMRVEHMKTIEELLVDSFAELMGGLLTYRPLLALTVKQYVRERYNCLPNVVTLVGLYAPAEDNVVVGRTEDQFSGNWLIAATAEVSFSNAGHPDIPSGPAPPPGSPYLCNMAVTSTYRRRGLGRQLLKAAEDVAIMMGAQDLYLHCRMVDVAPLEMYKGAGYQIIATDSILSLLTLQRRKYLMRKRLPSLSLNSDNNI